MRTRRAVLGALTGLVFPAVTGKAVATEIPSPRREQLVRGRAHLERLLADARPGDHFTLAAADYGTSPILLACRGTPDAPVVVRAEELLAVRLPGLEFAPSAQDILVWGFDLRDSESRLRGLRNILRRCFIKPPYDRTGTRIGVQCSEGSHCRIDYCNIELYNESETGGWAKDAVQFGIRGSFRSGGRPPMRYLAIERCDFSGGPLRLVYSIPYGNFCTTAPNVTESEIETFWSLRYCRVRNAPTHFSIFEAKSSMNLFEFLDVVSDSGRGYVSWRQGHGNVLRASRLSCHVRISRGPGNAAYDLHLGADSAIQVMAGKTPWNVYTNANPQAYRAYVAGIRGEGRIVVGETFGDDSRRFPALATRVEGISVPIAFGLHEDTVVREEIANGILLDEPVRLSDKDVGVYARWQG